MPYPVTLLATGALYLSGVVSRDFQTPTNSQINLAIDWLNDILADKTVDVGMIPYYSSLNFYANAGQSEYFIPNLIEVETLVFYINEVRYATTSINRRAFRGEPRAENINSLPFNFNVERQLGGALVSLYFYPSVNYPITIWGLFRMQQVQTNQDLELTLDRFYINYMKYKLAERIDFEYNFDVPIGVTKQLTEYNAYINKLSAQMDTTMSKISALSPVARGINYGTVNIGPWQPS